MRNVRLGFMFCVVLAGLLGGTICVRYHSVSTHTRDTIYVKLQDTTIVVMQDSAAVQKADTVINTVFVEIEKDCPQLSGKTEGFKRKIKETCTIESLTGGELKANSPDLRSFVRFIFKGNEATAVWEVDQREIQDKTENTIVEEKTKFISPPWWMQALNVWYLWVPAWAFVVLWAVARFR